MGCKSCKQKKNNIVSSLQDINLEALKEANDLLLRASEMDDSKWDIVEDVYMELFPTKGGIKRNCQPCLRNVAKAIQYEYNKRNKK